MIFTQKFFSSDYLFVYDFDDNNVVLLIHTTPESVDTLVYKIPYEEVVDAMVYAMCWRQWNEKVVIYVMTMIIALWRNIKWTMTLNICLLYLRKILEINYTYESLKQPMGKYFIEGNNTFYLSDIG